MRLFQTRFPDFIIPKELQKKMIAWAHFQKRKVAVHMLSVEVITQEFACAVCRSIRLTSKLSASQKGKLLIVLNKAKNQ